MERTDIREIFSGLRELGASAFPKRCRGCGREYASAAEFIAATRPMDGEGSGLKQSWDDDGQQIVDLFRNCACGSTLMESFNDRRDLSAAGSERRQHFEGMLGLLVAQGVVRSIACVELRKFLHGQAHGLLDLAESLSAASQCQLEGFGSRFRRQHEAQ